VQVIYGERGRERERERERERDPSNINTKSGLLRQILVVN